MNIYEKIIDLFKNLIASEQEVIKNYKVSKVKGKDLHIKSSYESIKRHAESIAWYRKLKKCFEVEATVSHPYGELIKVGTIVKFREHQLKITDYQTDDRGWVKRYVARNLHNNYLETLGREDSVEVIPHKRKYATTEEPFWWLKNTTTANTLKVDKH